MKILLLKTLAALGMAAIANAYVVNYVVNDPAGNLLVAYTESHVGAFDVLSADVGYNAITSEIVGIDRFSTVSASPPPKGPTLQDYTLTVWSIDSNVAGLGRLDYFAPDVKVSAVPEPATYGMLAAGLGLLAVAARRRAAGSTGARNGG